MGARAAFDVLPAIDLQGGRLARMRGGDPATLHALPGDPIAVARAFVEAGARWLHVVDLDAAFTGSPGNLDVLEGVARLPVRVQAGGGLSAHGVAAALARGADRAVLGAGAVSAWDDVPALVRSLGPRVALALDVSGERLRPRGSGASGRQLDDVLADVAALEGRPACLVVTFVERDGALSGPDVAGLARIARTAGIPVVASGGIRSVADLRALANVGTEVISGAIVGRALAEGLLDPAAALAVTGPTGDGEAGSRGR